PPVFCDGGFFKHCGVWFLFGSENVPAGGVYLELLCFHYHNFKRVFLGIPGLSFGLGWFLLILSF
ncbi:hypothetical protein ACNIRO_25275, partial [Escherichia coli]